MIPNGDLTCAGGLGLQNKSFKLYTKSPESNSYTVKPHFNALGLYNFVRGFGWAYKRGGLYPGGLTKYKRNKKMFRKDEIKRILEMN